MVPQSSAIKDHDDAYCGTIFIWLVLSHLNSWIGQYSFFELTSRRGLHLVQIMVSLPIWPTILVQFQDLSILVWGKLSSGSLCLNKTKPDLLLGSKSNIRLSKKQLYSNSWSSFLLFLLWAMSIVFVSVVHSHIGFATFIGTLMQRLPSNFT